MSKTVAAFWDPEKGDSSGWTRHSPDDESYQHPDARQLERMRSGIGLPVVVPKARDDGRSMGFDPTVASVVHVDPDAPDGGSVVDMSQLNSRAVHEAVVSSKYPHQAFYKLGISPSALARGAPLPPPPRSNPLLGSNAYLTPQASQDGRQSNNGSDYGNFAGSYPAPLTEDRVLNPAPPLPQIQPLQQPQNIATPVPYPPPQQMPPQVALPYPQPQQYPMYPPPPQPQYAPPPPPQMDPNLAALLSQLAQGVQALNQRVVAVEQAPRHSSESRPAPELTTRPVGPDPRPRMAPAKAAPRKKIGEDNPYAADSQKSVFEDSGRTARDHRRNHDREHLPGVGVDDRDQHLDDLGDDHRDGIIVGFETLGLPYITGPIGLKARRRVYFEFPETGKQSAFYHDVIESKNCIALVYDTRYEDGQQYEPPDLDIKQIKLHVPHLKKTFVVSSMGFSYPQGVFDHVVLVKHDVETLDYEDAK